MTEVFHFAVEIVFSILFNKEQCGLGMKCNTLLLPNQPYPSSLHVLLLHIGGVLCSVCDAFIL